MQIKPVKRAIVGCVTVGKMLFDSNSIAGPTTRTDWQALQYHRNLNG